MLKQSKGVKTREKQKDGSVPSLRGKCGKICVELKFLGVSEWHSTGSPERFFKAEQQMTAMIKQCW